MTNFVKKIVNFFIETKNELAKVSWPNRKTTFYLTAVVLTTILISMLFLAAVDFGLTEVIEIFINK